MAEEVTGAKIEIDQEFAALIPKQSSKELAGLEEQILRDGCTDPLKVWDHDGKLTLLDGHSRLKICQTHHKAYDTSTIEIKDRDDALKWIIDNQLGRRNLPKKQKEYFRGKRLELEKKIARGGGDRRSEDAENQKHQSDANDGKTSAKIAEQTGVSQATIERDAQFAKSVDEIKKVEPDLANKILKGKVKATRLEVKELAQKPDAEKKTVAENVDAGATKLIEKGPEKKA